jgi:hypothetical protein
MPVEDVELCHWHGVDDPLERRHGQEVPGGVHHQAAVRKAGKVRHVPRRARDLVRLCVEVEGHQLREALQGVVGAEDRRGSDVRPRPGDSQLVRFVHAELEGRSCGAHRHAHTRQLLR